MLRLDKLSSSGSIIVTLNEGVQIVNQPNFLFVFTNSSTKDVFKIIFLNANDVSQYKDRFNKFVFDTSFLFASFPVGDYTYFAYEQTDETNLDETGLHEVENGQMQLDGPVEEMLNYEAQDKVIEYVG